MLACLALLALAEVAGIGPALAQDEASALARAEAFLGKGLLYPAERAAREAIAQSPDDAAAHQLLGRILLRRQKPQQAIGSLSRARELDPSLAGTDRLLGDAFLELGDDARACDAYARALATEPDDAEGQLHRAQCAERLGDLDAAETALLNAARDPDLAQLALYELGVVRARAGKRDAARDAFERAVVIDPPSPLAGRAWAAAHELEQVKRSWSLSAGAGLVFDDNVTRPEVDVTTRKPDEAGQLELDATWQPPLPASLPELQLGYGLSQTLYVDATELDLQSHAMSASLRRKLGPGSASLSYLYSLNTLGGNRFLDLQDIRPAYGFSPKPTWYASFGPALQVKRFDQRGDRDRDALAGSVGTLQLFDFSGGAWAHYLLLGVDGEYEDAHGPQFDERGVSAQAALHWSLLLGERVLPFDLRYRFRWRDFLHDTTLSAATATAPAVTIARRDTIHSFRARTSYALHRFVTPPVEASLELTYEFEDSSSNLPSADYTQNVVTLLLRFAL